MLAMIDDGEVDWKALAIIKDDPLASSCDDVDDVPDYAKSGVREFFRWYKTPDGSPLNWFGYDEKYLNATEAKKVIQETHEAWKKLRNCTSDAGKLWIGQKC